MKKIGIVVTAFILAFVAFYVYNHTSFKNVDKDSNTSDPHITTDLPSNLAPQIPTDWQTYYDAKYGYNIAVPSTWQIEKTPAGTGAVARFTGENDVKHKVTLEIGMHAEKKQDNESLSAYEKRRTEGNPYKAESEKEQTLSNKLEVHKYIIPLTGGDGGASYGIYYIFERNGNVYFAEGYTSNVSKDESFFDKILASFNFSNGS